MSNIICYALNINLQIPNESFAEKSAFESGLLFLVERALFLNLSFVNCFRPNPYTRMWVSTTGSFLLFRKRS